MKQKLIELFRGIAHENCFGSIEKIVDYLIANGVTVQTEDEKRNTYTAFEIEEIQNEAYDLGVDSVLRHHFGLSWEDAAGLRKEVKRLQDATRWIPVSERLPQEDELPGAICEQVQVLLSNGVVSTGWCNRYTKLWWHLNYGETHFTGYDYEHTPVVAWQPLAQPPKEGDGK